MINNEYNKEILRVLQELSDTDISKIASESSLMDIEIIFVMHIRDILVNYANKRPTSREIMKEFNAILGDIRSYTTHVDEFNTCNKSNEQENFDFEYLYTNSVESLNKLEKYFASLREAFFIVCLQYGMKHLPDIDFFLHRIKVKSPSELIARVIELTNFEEETLQNEKIIWEKQYAFGGDKLNFLVVLSGYYLFRNEILDKLLRVDYRRIPPFLIAAKYLGNNYNSIFRERIEQYRLYFKNWDEFWEAHRVSFMQLNKNIVERMKRDDKDYANPFSFLASALGKIGYSKFYLDLHWLIYYVCYCHTPDFIDFCFSLLDRKLPLRFQEVFLQTVKKSVLAPIMQYEYEWYCRKHNQDPQFQFYEGEPINWEKLNVSDYDLDKWLSPLYQNRTLLRDNSSNNEFISVPTINSNELIPLPFPPALKELSQSEMIEALEKLPQSGTIKELKKIFEPQKIDVLRKLHDLTSNEYQESSENDFCYLLGCTPDTKEYDKGSCQKILWRKGKPELQYFITRLYKKDSALARGTWDKADNIFRIAGMETLKLKENTTTNIRNLSDDTKEEIDKFIEDTLKYIKEKNTW